METNAGRVKVYGKNEVREVEKPQPPKGRSSDFAALILGVIIVALTLTFWKISGVSINAIKYSSWSNFSELVGFLTSSDFFTKFIFTGVSLTLLFSISYKLMNKGKVVEFMKAFVVVYLLASLVYILSSQAVLKEYLEYAFWALFIGLIINNVFGLPKFLEKALHSDFYIKVGLVLMGTEVLFSNITKFGGYGIAISWVVVPIVILFMWWFGVHYLKMESPTMVMVIAVATSVCGVSAAVAAAASINAKKHDLTFAVGISIIFTIAMMVLMPLIVQALNISDLIGGAWIGNTVDSTGAVVLAGEALGPLASQVAAMVKMIQNVLIGFISFIIAVFFARREHKGSKTSMAEIWNRLPKFIFGFIGMSILFSFFVQPNFGVEATNTLIKSIGTWKGWCFCLTFLCIGLETNFKEMLTHLEGGKPVSLYVVGQLFSLVLSLGVCYLVLSGKFFPVPELTIL